MKARNSVSLSFFLPQWLQEPLLPVGLAAEIRESLPFWVTAVLLGGVGGLGSAFEADGFTTMALLISTLALLAASASVFGHPFAQRTVSLMLIQPVSRDTLWRRKMSLVLVMAVTSVLIQAAMAMLVMWLNNGWHQRTFSGLGVFSLYGIAAVLSVVLVTPWLTLASRSTLAGVVFTVALPALLAVASNLATWLWFGSDPQDLIALREFQWMAFLGLAVLTWLVAPFLGYRAFQRLEAVEARSLNLPWPRWLGFAPTRLLRPNPGNLFGKLAVKELHLLAPAFLVAALYLLICGALLATRLAWPSVEVSTNSDQVTQITTFLYAALVSLLIGALTCAEERQAGTLVWHLTLPLASWKQWAVKAGTALSLALILAIGLPVLVLSAPAALEFPAARMETMPSSWLAIVLQVVAWCTLGMYLSSTTTTTLRAMLWAAPVGFLSSTVLWTWLHSVLGRLWLSSLGIPGSGFVSDGPRAWPLIGMAQMLVWWLLIAVTLVLPLGCAWQNYRRLDRKTSRIFIHLGAMAAWFVVLNTVWVGFSVLWSRMPPPQQVDSEVVHQPRPSVQLPNPGYVASPDPSATPTPGQTNPGLPRMDARMLMRYGLTPPRPATRQDTNFLEAPASVPENSAPPSDSP
ncbi:MAG: hypothetical protein ACYDC1_21275 [Limisphaerales bacterium]